MANNHIITKDYRELRGFSTASKYQRAAFVADLAVNIMRQPDETFGPRRGYQIAAGGIGGLGCSTFENPCKCSTDLIAIDIDGSLYTTEAGTLTLTYTGSGFSDYLSFEIFVDPSTVSDPQTCEFDPYSVINHNALVNDRIVCKFYKNGSLILLVDFGKGYGVALPYLISDFLTDLATIPGLVATFTGNVNVPAAFIPIQEMTNIPHTTSQVLHFYSWKQVNKTVAAPFGGLAAQIANPKFQNATFANYQQVCYICTPFDFPQKYDGQTVYRAGMPEGAAPTASVTASPGNPNGTYTYNITYQQGGRIINGDPVGFSVEGVLSPDSASVSPVSLIVDVTVANLLAGSGWNTNGALVNGNQVGVTTINVQAGSTLKTGDTAFFLDASGVAHTREVTLATPTQITISGAAVSVNNGAPISNNLKINIWRNPNGAPNTKQLVFTVPNNSFSATTTWQDNVADANLGRTYLTPARPPNPPPKVAYVANYRNQLIYTGDPENEDYVWFSEGNNPEYVPSDPDISNNFILPANDDDVSGVGIAGSTLIIFKERSIYAISGDLLTTQFNVTPVSPGQNVGCASHHSIVQVGGTLYFLFNNGIYSITETTLFPTDEKGNPVPLSIDIDKFFRTVPLNYRDRFQLLRSVAINYTPDKQYILYLPAEDNPGTGSLPKFGNDRSRVLVFDYEADDWFEWTNINASGGFMILEDRLYWQDRTLHVLGTKTVSNLYRQHKFNRLIDYVDHVTPIRSTWRSSWTDGDQPKVRKKFLRAVLLFDDLSDERQTPAPQLCFKTYINWIEQQYHTKSTVSFANNANAWDTTPWNFAGWDGYQDTFFTVNLKQGSVAKALKLQLQMNKLNQSFNLKGFQLEMVPDFLQTVVR